MKVNVTQKDLIRLIDFYTMQLEDFMFRPASPAMLERINNKIELIRRRKMQETPGDVWKIMVKASFDRNSVILDPDDSTYNLI